MKGDRELKEGISRFLENDNISFRADVAIEVEDVAGAVQNDRNGNGMIDYKEDVYASMDALVRAAWIGKYPKKLSNNIYAVSFSTLCNALEHIRRRHRSKGRAPVPEVP